MGEEVIERAKGDERKLVYHIAGMAIAFCSAAQVCLLPIFGWWSDKRTMKVQLNLPLSLHFISSPLKN